MQIRSLHEYSLFAEAWCLLALARISLLCFSFKAIARWMAGKKLASESISASDDERALKEIATAIQRACRYSPWRTKCFEQALCARQMLKRRQIPSQIYFGVRKNPENGSLEAHAWVKSFEEVITGGRHTDTYQLLQQYT